MHRHGYKGKKFHRETDQRSALIKGLAESLIQHGSITTTLPKAKALRPYIEKLITKAKVQTLHSRRQVISGLQTVANANKLFDEIAPQFSKRNGGYTSIKRQSTRRGDNATMAKISFVEVTVEATKSVSSPKNAATKTPTSNKGNQPSDKQVDTDKTSRPGKTLKMPSNTPKQQKIVPKRSGVRGNK